MDFDIVDMIKKKMLENNLSIRKTAEMAGIPYTTFQGILTGEVKNPGIHTIKAILIVFGKELSLVESLEKPINPKLLLTPWNEDLYLKIVEYVKSKAQRSNKNIESQEALELIESIYYYCLSKSPPSPEETFADWLWDQKFTFKKDTKR